MSNVLSIRLEDELWDRVHSQQVQPRQVVTEALLHYFRYKDGNIPEINAEDPLINTSVYVSKQSPDGAVVIDKDIEWAKLEMEVELLKSKLESKTEMLADKDMLIDILTRDKIYFQNSLYIMRMHFMPARIGFIAGLLPSGRKAKKVREELDDLERKLFTGENIHIIDIEKEKDRKRIKEIKKPKTKKKTVKVKK